MRYGYWLPVFGGWLRNVPDEGMEASWAYVSRLAKRSEEIGYDITLIAELFMNDIKGIDTDSLEHLTGLEPHLPNTRPAVQSGALVENAVANAQPLREGLRIVRERVHDGVAVHRR